MYTRITNILFAFIFIIMIVLTACSSGDHVDNKSNKYPQLGKDRLEDVIDAMTIEEKVSMVMGLGLEDEAQKVLSQIAPGAEGITFAIPRLGIPSVIFCDGPAGIRVMNIKGTDKEYFTAFPIATAMASTWNLEMEKKVGMAMAREALEYNIDLILAPSMNIHRNPLNGRNFEYFSEDPYLSGNMGAAFVKGAQELGVGTTVKHLVANNHETNRHKCNSVVSQRALREIYLRGFEIAVKQGDPWAVMTSYNKVNGFYTPQNLELCTTLIRDEWRYKGLVMTDWWSGDDPVAQMSAGNEMIMPGSVTRGGVSYRGELLKALDDKMLDESVLDRNIKYILNLIIKLPHFNNSFPSTKADPKINAEISREAASEGIVLLKNKAAILPLSSEIKNIGLFGKTSYHSIPGGTGSGTVNYRYFVSINEGLRNVGLAVNSSIEKLYNQLIESTIANNPPGLRIPENTYDTHVWPYPHESPINFNDEYIIGLPDIKKQAKVTDIAIITLGRIAGEGTDRKENGFFLITDNERNLIKNISQEYHALNKKVIVVLNVSGVIETASWRDYADAIIMAWQPGQEVGNAVSDVLTGRVNPSGKLPMSFPIKYSDVPSSRNFPGIPANDPENSIYKEGIYVGYRYYETFNVPTAYEFGYGLSYTRFELSDLSLSDTCFNNQITVTITVKNIGDRGGKEVVQLYLSAPDQEIEKPVQELKGFVKTKFLNPGESQQIKFVLDAKALSSFWTGISAWVADKGNYQIKVGVSSNDIRQTASFSLEKQLIVEKTNNILRPDRRIDEISPRNK